MHVLVINGSPSGKNSITLQTALFIEKHFKSALDLILYTHGLSSLNKFCEIK